ncbi:hypothetical protein CIT26_30100 [Mesorhizobium temperatum]|uniref:Uncharacterized protein n=1 Tax=Mesorhizobium temperatum TaxID=241416 RepID=A0A271LBW3_9HYPH|nr:hypothetical protein CIT26_30100 [Mesorhizobium temperatum]
MTLDFVLSKMRQILLRLRAVDTSPPARRDSEAERFARAMVRPIYSRNGIRVSVSPRNPRNRE